MLWLSSVRFVFYSASTNAQHWTTQTMNSQHMLQTWTLNLWPFWNLFRNKMNEIAKHLLQIIYVDCSSSDFEGIASKREVVRAVLQGQQPRHSNSTLSNRGLLHLLTKKAQQRNKGMAEKHLQEFWTWGGERSESIVLNREKAFTKGIVGNPSAVASPKRLWSWFQQRGPDLRSEPHFLKQSCLGAPKESLKNAILKKWREQINGWMKLKTHKRQIEKQITNKTNNMTKLDPASGLSYWR